MGASPDSDRFGAELQDAAARPEAPGGVPALWWSVAALMLGVAMTLWASSRQHARALQERDAMIARVADDSFDAVSNRLQACERLLRSVQTVFLASDAVSPGEFMHLYENLRPRSQFPGLQALAYAERQGSGAGATSVVR